MIERHILVRLGDGGVFCTEVSIARADPEVVVGALMVHLPLDEDDDPAEFACEALRQCVEDD